VAAITPARTTVAAFGLAVAASAALLAVPIYSGLSDGEPVRATLLEVNGTRALVPIVCFPLAALVPVLAGRQWARVGAAILIGAFSFLGIMTIGLFYLPAAILLALAASASEQ
jgi:hypothetical protein